MLHPDALLGGWERYQNKDINNDILISYGYGDGGGGPTRGMLENSMRLEKGVTGLPTVRQCFADVYKRQDLISVRAMQPSFTEWPYLQSLRRLTP